MFISKKNIKAFSGGHGFSLGVGRKRLIRLYNITMSISISLRTKFKQFWFSQGLK